MREAAVVGQDFRNPLPAHCRHGYAVHKTIALVIALLIQTQARQKGLARLRMNGNAPVLEDLPHGMGGYLPQMRAALGQAVQKFGSGSICVARPTQI